MKINPRAIPFSIFGSYMAVNYLWWDWAITPNTPKGWYIRGVGARSREVFELIPVRNETVLTIDDATAIPGQLTLYVDGGTIECTWADTATLHIRVRGCQLRLRAITRAWANAYQTNGAWMVIPDSECDKFLCLPLCGALTANCQWLHRPSHDQVESLVLTVTPDTSGEAQIAICADEVQPYFSMQGSSFDNNVRRIADDFARFLASFPALDSEYAESRDLAAYVLWVSTVAQRGHFAAPAVLMSKNWMDSVWSWDHCFTAFGLARAHPELAWQQFMLPFYGQHPSGVLPDSINARSISWMCTKPPIHGWALLRLLRMTEAITPDHLREAYEPLSRWARFWLEARTFDESGLPYFITGNEQFDNITLFQVHAPYQSADLAAYVVLLQEALAVVAERIGRPTAEASAWRLGAFELQSKIVPHFWREHRFVAPRYGDGATASNECLFRYTPIVLGSRLPTHVTDTMIADLQSPDKWLTPSGALATEALDSGFYDDASYVRGPIWAPPNLIIYDGLRHVGASKLAATIRHGFCSLCVEQGMAENFNGRTGKAQRDPAYTWTPGAFLALAEINPQ